MTWFGKRSRSYLVAGFVAVLMLASGGQAVLAQGCAGSYAATALHPMPQHPVVGLDIRDASPQNVALGQRFMQGIKDGGARIDGTRTVSLSVTYSLLGLDLNRGSSGPERSYDDWSGLAGGLNPTIPSESRMRLSQPARPRGPVTLALRVEMTRTGDSQVIWVMSLQCQYSDTDPMELAYAIGRAVGGSVGRTVGRRSL